MNQSDKEREVNMLPVFDIRIRLTQPRTSSDGKLVGRTLTVNRAPQKHG